MITRAVTANVEHRLSRAAARRCLGAALAVEPDIVALQEWRAPRFGLLRDRGCVRVVGTPVTLPARGGGDYVWVAGVAGDCVVGLRQDRYRLRRTGQTLLSLPTLIDPATGRRAPLLPPRWATLTEAVDRWSGRSLGVVAFHLVPGAQRSTSYRRDCPRTVRQHRREVSSLQRTLAELGRRLDAVWALGDTNFHGLELDGLTSAWRDLPAGRGTLTSYRRVDDVFGPGPATDVELFHTESDHRMVVVERTLASGGT